MEAIVEPVGPGQLSTDPVTPRVDARVHARFVAIYTSEYPRVLSFVWRRTGSRQVAEDLTSEVFRIAWEQAAGGTPSTGWLFVTARNLVLAHHRSTQRAETGLRRLAHEAATQPSWPSADDPGPPVLVALDRLPEGQRELLTAYYWDELGGAECAALAGCSVGAVWVRLHRARAALRVQLENLRGESPCE